VARLCQSKTAGVACVDISWYSASKSTCSKAILYLEDTQQCIAKAVRSSQFAAHSETRKAPESWWGVGRVSGCRIKIEKRFGKGSAVLLTCVVGVRYDARFDERLIEVPSTSKASCGATGTRKCCPQRVRRYRKDVQAHRKDADACCRMTTSLRVRRMKAVPTRIFTGRVRYVHQYMYTVIAVSCELTSVIGQ